MSGTLSWRLDSLTLNEVLSPKKTKKISRKILKNSKVHSVVLFAERKIPSSNMRFKHDFVTTLEQEEDVKRWGSGVGGGNE